MPTRTILIDDHRQFNDGLCTILRASADFTVVEQVYDSRLAYEACCRHAPDLVLVDFNMPYHDGLAVVNQLKRLPTRPKIVIITLYAEVHELARFNALGVQGYVAKIVAADRLLTLLKQVMQGETVLETGVKKVQSASQSDHFRPKHPLTKRELQILEGMKQGLTPEQIVVQLGLSSFTVQTHLRNINQKLAFKTKTSGSMLGIGSIPLGDRGRLFCGKLPLVTVFRNYCLTVYLRLKKSTNE